MIAELREQRGDRRYPSAARVTIRQGTTELAGELLNISSGGFCARLERFVASNAPVRVTLEGLGSVEARLAWGQGQVYGFEFTDAASAGALLCDEQSGADPAKPVDGAPDNDLEASGFTGHSRFGGAAAALVLASLHAVGATVQGMGHRIRSLLGPRK